MKLKELHTKLYHHLDDQSKNWNSFIYAQEKGFYQGFEEIKVDGCRPTEKRFKDYDIKKYLSKNKTVLDIGCNCGFFSLYTSRFVKQVNGVEINPHLIAIANDTQEYMDIKNVKFHTSSFENFVSTENVDIILSFANDSTIDGNTKFNFTEYIEKILSLLAPEGLLIFESQALDNIPPTKFMPKLEFLKTKFSILENRKVFSEYPINIPERIFLILQKR